MKPRTLRILITLFALIALLGLGGTVGAELTEAVRTKSAPLSVEKQKLPREWVWTAKPHAHDSLFRAERE